MRKFEYFEPKTAAEAISLLESYDARAAILAGGTNIIPALKEGRLKTQFVVNIKNIEGLNEIHEDSGGIHIGALVTQSDLSLIELTEKRVANSTLVERIPAWFRKIISLMGNPQVRNIATIAGNLAWASPAADSAPPLLTLDAELRIRGPEGERVLPIDQFFLGPGKCALEPNEMITEILIPMHSLRKAGMAQKFMKRKANTLSVCSAAVSFTRESAGFIRDVRIAVGAVAPVPKRIIEAESLLEGEKLDDEILRKIKETISQEIDPIIDGRSTAWFRRTVTPILVERCLTEAAE